LIYICFINRVFTGNNNINDSIPKEWQGESSLKDCILPISICNPRNSKMDCHTNSNSNESSTVTSCQSKYIYIYILFILLYIYSFI